MMELNDIATAASNILVAIENTFDANSVALPSRKYTTIGGQGTVAYDCAQLTVSWEQSYSGLPGQQSQEMQRCEGPTTGVFIVELVRDIPVSQQAHIPPEPGLIQSAADKLMQDVALLYAGGMAACANTGLEQGLIDISAGTPSGALQSIIMTVAMEV